MIHEIQACYGWHDEYILQMPYARLVQIARTIGEAKADEVRDEYQRAAYIGWQNYLTQMMVWGGKKKPKDFKQWLVSMKLAAPDKPLTPEEEQQIQEQAIQDAEEILKQFSAS